MKNLMYIIGLFCLASPAASLFAQPNYIYEGGSGSGFSSIEDVFGTEYQFEGGNGIGYTSEEDLIASEYQFLGGIGDGYSEKKEMIENSFFFSGGEDGGFASTQIIDNSTTKLFNGGSNDGYFKFEKCEEFIWTGAIGTGWLESGNWNYNIIPDLKRNVIIPIGVPNFPHLNEGVFAIGDNPNNGAFECGQLWIQEGSLLVTRLNNKVENYGNIKIDGIMNVKNSIFDAFLNLENGLIRISSTGSLIIKP